jgi:hypothetical protein
MAGLTLFVGGAAAQSSEASIQLQVIGGGLVEGAAGVNIKCGVGSRTCFYSTSNTGDVTLHPTDQGVWTFDSWDGCTSLSEDDCTVALSAGSNREITADFTAAGQGTKVLDVTVTGDASGGGNVSGDDIDCDSGDTGCSDEVAVESTLTMVEEPDTGYIFGGWGKDCSGTARSCVVQMNADHSVSASFRKPRLTVTVNGTGTVTGGGIACTSGSGSGCAADETADTDVTLTATPPSGGSFTGWSGACSGSNAVCTVTMSADRNVTATFSGGGGGVAPSTFPLTVSVAGDGTVTGGGLNCGAGATNCSANLNAGTNVNLTATPEDGETFTSWGGSCSGSTATCSLTMNAAKSVTATFSGGSTATVALAVIVTGHGVVTGGGISCGNGKATCAAKVKQDSTVGLTATPGPGATFIGWSGACNGRTPTCTLQMDQAKKVSATFRGGRAPAAAHAALRSVGPPIVRRTSSGYEVTLRYTSSRRGKARIRALRAGRLESALTFNAAAGRAIAGPFPVAKSGFYSFELHLGANTLRWTACLGRCGEHASPDPFTLTRGLATAVDAGALWSLTLHFRSNTAAGVVVRVYRGKQLAREVRFPVHAGPALPGALLLSPGNYRVELRATDAVGRVRTLAWYALLP